MDIRLFSKRLDGWFSSKVAFMCALSFLSAGCRFAFDRTGSWEFAYGPDTIHMEFGKRFPEGHGGTQQADNRSDFGMDRLGNGDSTYWLCPVCGRNLNPSSSPF